MAEFRRFDTTYLYLSADATQATARLGYLLPNDADPPASLSLEASLTGQQGAYLFFPSLPQTRADLDTFIQDAWAFLTDPGRQGTRFAWFPSTSGPLDGQILRVDPGPVTADRVDFAFQNYTLRLVQGNSIRVSGNGLDLEFTPGGGDENVLIASAGGIEPPVAFNAASPLRLPILATEGPGCFAFDIEANHDGLNALDVGLRYFMTSADDPDYADSLRYPVFDLAPPSTSARAAATDATELALSARFDPLDQLSPDRTYFGVSLASGVSKAAAASIRSYFLNPLGEPMRLIPGAQSRLVFNTRVQYAPPSAGGDDIQQPYYLALAGDYAITAPAPTEARAEAGQFTNNVICGLSGVEYVALSAQGATQVSFVNNSKAWAPATWSLDPDNGQLDVQFAPLTDQARTSWIWIKSTEAAGLDYYAQPDTSVLYVPPAAENAAASVPFLYYGAMKAGELDAGKARTAAPGEAPAFPMVPYNGIQAGAATVFAQLERQILNPTRRERIPSAPAQVFAARGGEVSPKDSTTPQGLLLRLDGLNWKGLVLGESLLKPGEWSQVNPPAAPYPPIYDSSDQDGALLLYDVIDPLQGALLSNQVFVVASSGAKLLDSCSVPYVLTPLGVEALNRTANVPVTVTNKLRPLLNQTFVSTTAYQSAVKALLTDQEFASFGAVITSYSAKFSLVIEGFEFDLSPYVWDRYRTMLLFKFQDRSIADLAADLPSWSRGAAFNDVPESTQQTLLTYIDSARKSDDPDLLDFLATVIDNKNWNGILALNARVPLTGLPDELKGLAAGIDAAQFAAHHVGINVTPVQLTGATLKAKPSSMFGLIRYSDTSVLQPSETGYEYTVRTLKVLMRNSQIHDFSSQVDLLVVRLFGDPAQLIGSQQSLIRFDGIYQVQAGEGAYLFTNQDRNAFQMNSKVLERVVVTRAQFVTLGEVTTAGVTSVRAKFLLSGTIVFLALPGFDVFSFGDASTGAGLAFTNLSVDMTFDAVIPSYKEFSFNAREIALDPATSAARPGSLYSHFPLKLNGLASGGADSRPDKQNFMPVTTVLASGGLSDTWYALSFTLDLGTPGALAQQIAFNAGFIAAWSPATSQTSLFIGLSLPGVKGGERAITLEGPLKLTFGDINFLANGTAYILQLRNIALSIFSITMPPSGQTNIILFGDPAGKNRDTLGWYAAYVKSGSSSKNKQLPGLGPGVLTHEARASSQVIRASDARQPARHARDVTRSQHPGAPESNN